MTSDIPSGSCDLNCREKYDEPDAKLLDDFSPSSNVDNMLNVQIVNFTKVVNKFESFVVFRLTTKTNRTEFPNAQLDVERRYSEFEWLHSRLSRSHPALFVPPLPGKMLKATLDRFSESHLAYRSSRLCTFLRRMSRHPILSADPDYIAFLSYSTEDFKAYQLKHSTRGTLSTMFFNLLGLSGESVAQNNRNSLVSSSEQDSLIVPNAMRPYEQQFHGFFDEVERILSVTQRLARCTEFISNHMDGLSLEYADLSRCLEVWPLSLTSDYDNTATNLTASSSPPQGQRVLPLPGRKIRLDWERNRPVPPSLIAEVSRQVSSETVQLARRLRTDILPNWQDAAAYAQSVRAVLNSRIDLENRYIDAVERVEADASSRQQGESGSSRHYLVWHKRPTAELISDANHLQDQVTLFNDQIRYEFSRWRSERREESVSCLLKMAQYYADYWTRVADAWRSMLVKLEGKSVSSEITKNNIRSQLAKEGQPRQSDESSCSTETPKDDLCVLSLDQQNDLILCKECDTDSFSQDYEELLPTLPS